MMAFRLVTVLVLLPISMLCGCVDAWAPPIISHKTRSLLLVEGRKTTDVANDFGPLFSFLDDDGDNNKASPDGVDVHNFNPFHYQKTSRSNSAFRYSAAAAVETSFSLRKITMQELTNMLINCAGNTKETQRTLEEYKDFLLEPLEDLEAVLVRQQAHRK